MYSKNSTTTSAWDCMPLHSGLQLQTFLCYSAAFSGTRESSKLLFSLCWTFTIAMICEYAGPTGIIYIDLWMCFTAGLALLSLLLWLLLLLLLWLLLWWFLAVSVVFMLLGNSMNSWIFASLTHGLELSLLHLMGSINISCLIKSKWWSLVDQFFSHFGGVNPNNNYISYHVIWILETAVSG